MRVQKSMCHSAPRPLTQPVQVLKCRQPYHTNIFVVLVGENGVAKQEQQKRLNADVPSKCLLLLLVISRLLQLITPIKEFFITLLQVIEADIPTLLIFHLFHRLLLCKSLLLLQQLYALLILYLWKLLVFACHFSYKALMRP